ncbi:Uncharacterised protein [Serratia proteamaculans]|nr:Uncharacterised protein [Serratia proteamaculans]
MPFLSYRILKQRRRAVFFSWQTLRSILRALGTLLTLAVRLWLMLQPGGTSFPPAPKSATSPRPGRTRT